MRRVGFGVLIVTVVSVLGFVYWKQRDELSEMRREVRVLKDTRPSATAAPVVRMFTRERVGYQPPDVAAPSSSAASEVTGLPQALPANAATGDSEFREAQDTVAATFAEERVDDAWAASSVRDLRERLTSTLPISVKLGRVECRTSMCRVEFSYDDSQALSGFFSAFLRDPDKRPWNGATMVIPGESPPDGPLVSVLFYAREGHPLPLPPPTSLD